MTDFGVLLDAPDSTARRIQIARLGTVSDPRYGDFDITAQDAEDWKRNLCELPGGRSLVDFEHRSEKSPRNSEAAGWVTGVDLDGEKIMADVEWSDKGEEAIQNKRYLFLSPAFGKYRNERGEVFDNTLVSVGLTNKPVLGSLPMLTLASAERVSEAVDDDPALRFHTRALDGEYGEATRALVMLDVDADERKLALKEGNSLPDGSYPIRNTAQLHSAAILAASGHGDAAAAKKLIKRRAKELGVDLKTLPGFSSDSADSRAAAMDQAILSLLELPEDADEAKILEAVTALKDKAAEPADPPETKTLEQQAADAGKVVLDQARYNEIAAGSAAGAAAAKELRETKFDNAFTTALKAGKALEAQREQYTKFFELDAEGTLKMLEEAPQLLNVKPTAWDNGTETGDVKTMAQLVDEKLTELGEGATYDQAYLKVLDDIEKGKS